ncbi:hypothetical protein BD324DRAFT_15378 [Kockovaella imperatae]|uniref:Uncharacterized protein n=1 Tax=Kockovaella imperatae TaxID=4999 RepID=A0A1Y1USQ9_9TREE|nr:hypothetical protein BD324DRAFT_15378 [Kockovaella imperatae]ORX40677.1 hypothetical protein BD324DRAFT_15378 [Kockovaella imperatae]
MTSDPADIPHQVNDLFATTSDPGAWEFRHPLFRRGEPHLLASIKRKTTRPTTADGPNSPPDDSDTGSRAVAGWMLDSPAVSAPRPGSSHASSNARALASTIMSTTVGSKAGTSPKADPEAPAETIYGHDVRKGESVTSSSARDRAGTRAWAWDGQPIQPIQNIQSVPLASHHSQSSDTTTSNRPPATAPSSISRFYPGSNAPSSSRYLDSPYYPQPSSNMSAVDVLADQVANLEERLGRAISLLNDERVDNVRESLNATSYMLRLTDWIGSERNPHPSELHALRETLQRSSTELRQRYEVLVTSDPLLSGHSAGTARLGHGYDDRPYLSHRRSDLLEPRPSGLGAHTYTPRASPMNPEFPRDRSSRIPGRYAESDRAVDISAEHSTRLRPMSSSAVPTAYTADVPPPSSHPIHIPRQSQYQGHIRQPSLGRSQTLPPGPPSISSSHSYTHSQSQSHGIPSGSSTSPLALIPKTIGITSPVISIGSGTRSRPETSSGVAGVSLGRSQGPMIGGNKDDQMDVGDQATESVGRGTRTQPGLKNILNFD